MKLIVHMFEQIEDILMKEYFDIKSDRTKIIIMIYYILNDSDNCIVKPKTFPP